MKHSVEVVKIPAMSQDIVESLASVIARRHLVATPEQCEKFYATEEGKRMLALIKKEREKRAARQKEVEHAEAPAGRKRGKRPAVSEGRSHEDCEEISSDCIVVVEQIQSDDCPQKHRRERGATGRAGKSKPMSMNELAKEIHQNAVAHGWWEEERSFGDIVSLCHSELSEALEEFRAGRPMEWHECEIDGFPCDKATCECEDCEGAHFSEKPEGIAVEMADCLIRILDWFGKEGLDVDRIIREKMEYNKSRPYRHGGKKL